MPQTNPAWRQESLRRTQAALDREVYLGRGLHTGYPYYMRPTAYLETSMHVIGAPGSGKSRLLEHILREYTRLSIPASLIDPHRHNLARPYYEWLLRNPRLVRERNIIYFEPGSTANTVGFNPFACGLTEPSDIASLVLEAILKVWGADSSDATPRLERILRMMLIMFAANNVPLTQFAEFLRAENRAFRETLLARVDDEDTRQNWRDVEELPKSAKVERFESSWNRMQRFAELPAIRRVLTADTSLNFRTILDRGAILVANIATLATPEAQRLMGTLLVNALYHAAKRRAQEKPKPWMVAIDEFPQFVTSDIARSLDELRKFGVHLMLAHQHLAQIKDRELLGSVMTSAKMKVVFGGLTRQDAEVLAHELFSGEIRGDRVKHITYQTKFRPRIEERDVETYTGSTTESASDSTGWSSGTSYGSGDTDGDSRSERWRDERGDETVTRAFSTSRSLADSSGESGSRSRSQSTTQGYSRGKTFVTEHDQFSEETGRQFWSPDEQWEELIAHVMNLDKRQALVKIFNRPVLDIRTPDVERLPQRAWRKSALLPTYRRAVGRKNAPQPTATPPMPPPARTDELPEDFRE